MKEMVRNANLIHWVLGLSLFFYMSIANSAINFITISLPKGITVELPKNWTALTNNERITLDSWVEAKAEAKGLVDVTHDLAFAANYFDDHGITAGIFNIRYYPDLDVTQSDARTANASDVKELDTAIRQNIAPGIEMAGGRLLDWVGTTKQLINGATVFVSEYRRLSQQGGSFRVRLVRFLNAHKSFTITISYREDQEFFLQPICDRVIRSIRI